QWLGTHQWQAGFKYQLPAKEIFFLTADYSEHYQQAWFDTVHYHGALRNLFSKFEWIKIIGKHFITAGVDYRLKYYGDNTQLSDLSITDIGNYAHTAGVYAYDQIKLNPQNNLFAGLRFDYSNLSGPIASPRLSFKWNSSDLKNIIHLSAGTGYRVPDL